MAQDMELALADGESTIVGDEGASREPDRLRCTTTPGSVSAFLVAQMHNVETQWSVGTFGAIAEFMRDAEEPARIEEFASSIAASTDRGAIRIEPRAALRLVATETPSGDTWSHRVALCLPAAECAMSGRTVLTELGADSAAVRPGDRTAILFDLGLDLLQIDACIRVADSAAIGALRDCLGQSVFDHASPAFGIILRSQPHRVFISRVGRAEVFQPIPPSDGKSPEGPHTHLLPGLLKHRRTHAATEPIPHGWIPCAHLYPAHPLKDGLGRRHPFDPIRHAAFQEILGLFGDNEFLAMKQRIAAAVAAGDDPSRIPIPDDRHARAVLHVLLRQLQHSGDPYPALAHWLARKHTKADTLSDAEETHPGHG